MSAFKRFIKLLDKVDVILEVIDARVPEESRVKKIEKIAKVNNKKIIIILNKVDLVPYNFAKSTELKLKKEGFEVVQISTKNRWGKRTLIKTILKSIEKRPVYAMIVGFPNVGKSSIINYLKGSKSVFTSPYPGFTKGEQIIKIIEKKLYIFDMPGIILPSSFKRKILCSCYPIEKIKDIEFAGNIILEKLNERAFFEFYGMSKEEFFKKYKNPWKKLLVDWYKGNLGLAKQEKGYWGRYRAIFHPFVRDIESLIKNYEGPISSKEIWSYLIDKIPKNVKNVGCVIEKDDFVIFVLVKPKQAKVLEKWLESIAPKNIVKIDKFSKDKLIVILSKKSVFK